VVASERWYVAEWLWQGSQKLNEIGYIYKNLIYCVGVELDRSGGKRWEITK